MTSGFGEPAAPQLPLPDRVRTVRDAVRTLRDGGVIAIPTDTVYGLVALFDNEDAIRRIFELKRRPSGRPLPLLFGTAAELPLAVERVPDSAWPLIYRFWPGALTIVMPARRSLSSILTAGTGTAGCRVPSDPVALDILEALSLPLASTSANLSGEPPLMSTEGVAKRFGRSIDMIIPSEPTSRTGVASTVVDITRTPPLILRRGSITVGEIRDTLATRVDIGVDA